jgi:membrane-associated protein
MMRAASNLSHKGILLDTLAQVLSFLVHIDQQMGLLITQYGGYIYAILFLIVFGETGFVVLPFLPGDSLLFIAGAFAAEGAMDPWVLSFLLIGAAILGNTVNYMIGRLFGKKVLETHSRWISRDTLLKAHEFYEKHGGKAVILSRFLPLFRTFVPFIAGVSEMSVVKFQQYNVLGAVLWVMLFVWGGYYFGQAEFNLFGINIAIKDYLGTIAIVGISMALVPVVLGVLIQFVRHKRKPQK